MTSSALVTVLRAAGRAGVAVCLWGDPGIGKSSLIQAAAAADGVPCETVIGSLREPSDFAGLPVVTDDGVRLEAPSWAKRLDAAQAGYLFLDELPTAPPTVQAAMLGVALERRVGDLPLPRGVHVVAAANLPERAADGWDLSAHVTGRQAMRTVADVPFASGPPPTSRAPIPSETKPTVAAALFAAWSGDPAVVVASPPGAGKTSLVVQLAEQLNRRAGLSVAIATQTRVQALDVTNRAARIGASVALLGTRNSRRPLDLEPRAHYLAGAADLRRWRGVVVATTARWLWVHERDYAAEVCVIDEAGR